MRESVVVAMAYVGLLVGAGFATGKEMLQYFVSFGIQGFWGVFITGTLMAVLGAVVLQIGSYFLADEHSHVFNNVAHPIVSRILDVTVSLTMATMGMIMLAGAGSSLHALLGVPPWLGSAALAVVVYFVCFLDAERVSEVIGFVTPLMIVAVIIVFVWTLTHIPSGFSIAAANRIGQSEPAPVSPWWWSAINCGGLSLMCAIGMSLVIGGSYTKMRNVAFGGLIGGVILGVMMAMETVILYINIEQASGKDIPMAAVVSQMNGVAGIVLSIIILLMIFNTALGDFYAFSKRIDTSVPTDHRINLAIILSICWAISLFGFSSLIQVVFPILGYLGTAIGILFVVWWLRSREQLRTEGAFRDSIRILTRTGLGAVLPEHHSRALSEAAEKSVANPDKLIAVIAAEERSTELKSPSLAHKPS